MNFTVHEGQLLKHHLKSEGISYLEIQKKMNISAQSLYYQLRREYLTPKFKHKLMKVGIQIFSTENLHNMSAGSGYHELKREIIKLQELVAEQIRQVQVLKESLVGVI